MAFDAQQKRLLFGVAALIGGIAAILQGWSLLCDWREARRIPKQKQLGTGGLGESLADANVRTKGVITNVTRYNVKSIKERVSLIAGLARKDYLKPAIRESALAVLTRKTGSGENRKWAVPPKDWKAEVEALYRATTDPRSDLAVRYTLDPARVDMYTSPEKTQILKGEDCLPGYTLLQTPYGFKPIAEIQPGDVVMGDGGWTHVTRWWDKGVLPVRSMKLSTGSTLLCTDDHRLFSVVKSKRGHPGERMDAVEVRAGDVEEGEQLLTPAVLPCGKESLTIDLAWLLGTFIADGWVVYQDGKSVRRIGIAGKDGHPKEEQKRRVQDVATSLGWKSTWHERYIDVWPDEQWLSLFVSCGRGAPNKHLPMAPSVFDKETARNVLSGLMADGGWNKGSFTYSTTSAQLALQIRILHRMLGERVNIRRVDDHGGLGTNPIYRIALMQTVRADGRRPSQFALVHNVTEDVQEEHVYDIEVENHRFYLPEHDIVVHNCDGITGLLSARLMSVGYSPQLITMGTATSPNKDFSHILLRVPRPSLATDGSQLGGPDDFVILDPSMPEKGYGWEPPGLSDALRLSRPMGVVTKAKVYKI